MNLTAAQAALIVEWGIRGLEQVDDHPFAWWGMRGDDYVVVKAGDPGERAREAEALRAFGAGATDVVAHDPRLGLLVTARVLPGDDIRPLASIFLPVDGESTYDRIRRQLDTNGDWISLAKLIVLRERFEQWPADLRVREVQ